MKQTIPFRKDITFKTKIGELTAISLDNDLTLKGEDLIVGNFYISGNYKMLEGSISEEEYSYKIPCEIAISDDYDTYDATIDIDDFYYEIINDEILRVNITVVINNLERKEVKEEPLIFEDEVKEEEVSDDLDERSEEKDEDIEILDEPKEEPVFKDEVKLPLEEEFDEAVVIDKIEDDRAMSFLEVKENVKKQTDTYLTYKVYIVKDDDTIDKILEKYNITKEQLSDYNNLDEIMAGTKLVIPSFND